MKNQKNQNKLEFRFLSIIKDILVKDNTIKEKNKEKSDYIYTDIMQDKKIVSTNLYISKNSLNHKKTEYCISEILLAIFVKMYNQGYYEISLKNQSIEEYVKGIKKVLTELDIPNDFLNMNQPERTYSAFKNFIIKCVYERDCGYFDENFELLTLNMYDFSFDTSIEKNKKIKKIIEKVYIIITQNNNKPQKNKEKKYILTPKNKRSIKSIDLTGSIC